MDVVKPASPGSSSNGHPHSVIATSVFEFNCDGFSHRVAPTGALPLSQLTSYTSRLFAHHCISLFAHRCTSLHFWFRISFRTPFLIEIQKIAPRITNGITKTSGQLPSVDVSVSDEPSIFEDLVPLFPHPLSPRAGGERMGWSRSKLDGLSAPDGQARPSFRSPAIAM